MSSFINGSTGLPVTVHAATDFRHGSERFFGSSDVYGQPLLDPTWLDDDGTMGWAGAWWPRANSLIGGAGDGTDTSDFLSKPPQWGDMWNKSGAVSAFVYTGISRDQFGSALGGCTVRMYRVATEELTYKAVSDANGRFYVFTPYNDAHWLTVHSPDGTQGGATANSLLAA